jgi:hypothetical protein
VSIRSIGATESREGCGRATAEISYRRHRFPAVVRSLGPSQGRHGLSSGRGGRRRGRTGQSRKPLARLRGTEGSNPHSSASLPIKSITYRTVNQIPVNVDVFWACVRRGLLVSAVGVTRPEELAAIDDFIGRYGLTRLEPRYADETQGCVSMAMAAHRLAGMKLQHPLDFAKMLHVLLMWSGRR